MIQKSLNCTEPLDLSFIPECNQKKISLSVLSDSTRFVCHEEHRTRHIYVYCNGTKHYLKKLALIADTPGSIGQLLYDGNRHGLIISYGKQHLAKFPVGSRIKVFGDLHDY